MIETREVSAFFSSVDKCSIGVPATTGVTLDELWRKSTMWGGTKQRSQFPPRRVGTQSRLAKTTTPVTANNTVLNHVQKLNYDKFLQNRIRIQIHLLHLDVAAITLRYIHRHRLALRTRRRAGDVVRKSELIDGPITRLGEERDDVQER